MLQAIASEMKPTTFEAGPLLIPTGFGSLLFPDNPAQIYDMPVYTLGGQEVALADTSVAGFGGTADIVLGSLEVPFYLDPEDPVGGFGWGFKDNSRQVSTTQVAAGVRQRCALLRFFR